MTSILNKMWRASQPANASSPGSGFTPINGGPDKPTVSQDNQGFSDEPKLPESPSVHQGNYIRSIKSRDPLESQTTSMNPAASRLSKKMTNSKMSIPAKPKAPKATKMSSSLEARSAKKTLKNFEVLKASAKPVALIAPMGQETALPRSPITPVAQEIPISPAPLSVQRVQTALLLPGPTANSKIRMSPSISGTRSTQAVSDKPSSQHTYQASDEQKQALQHTYPEDMVIDYRSPPLFIAENDSLMQDRYGEAFRSQSHSQQENDLVEQENNPTEQEHQKEVLETRTDSAQGNDEGEARASENDHESVQSDSDGNEGSEEEYEIEDILNHEYRKDKLYLYLKWKGYDDSENTWEPEESLVETATDTLQGYFDAIGGRPKNVGRPRKRLSRKRVLPQKESDEYLIPSPRLETPEPWSPLPPEKDNWEEHIFRINHMCKVGDQVLVGVIWIVEDQEGNRYQTQQEYWAVRLAAPIALLKYFEGSIRFEDTPEIGIPMDARFHPAKKAGHSSRANQKNESRSRKRSLQESNSFTMLPTRQKKSKG